MVRKERRLLSLFGVCVPNYKSQTIRPSPFPKNRWGNPAAGPGPAAQTQHRPLQARRCSFMSRLPSMNLRIFPNIRPAPYPLSGCNPSPVSLPSVSLVPLLRSQATPFPTCWTEPKKKPETFSLLFWCRPRFLTLRVHRKHSNDVTTCSSRKLTAFLFISSCRFSDMCAVNGGKGTLKPSKNHNHATIH